MKLPGETQSGGNSGSPLSNDPLRVAYVLKMFPRFSETFILNEILELERRGIQVVTFSMKEPNESLRQPGVARVKGKSYTIPPLRGWNHLIHFWSHLQCLLRSPSRYFRTLHFSLKRGSRAAWTKFLVAPYIVHKSRRHKIEHFHAHFASGPARQAKFTSMISGIPFTFTSHAKDLFWEGHRHGKNNKLKKRIRLASSVVTISEYNREFIHSLDFKVPRRRVVTIYNALDLEQWQWMRPDGMPLNASQDKTPMILAVGRLVPKKGFDVLVEACRILNGEGLRFRCIIAGDGPEGHSLDEQIRNAGLENMFILAGSIPQDRLIEHYYMMASLLVQPSIVGKDGDQDGIPTVILESMAVGLPVVATDVSGISEAVINGETGFLVETGKPQVLAEAMKKILVDPQLAAHLSQGGKELIEKRFNLRNNAKILLHLMMHAARGTPRWSEMKIRERVGLGAPDDPGIEERTDEIPVENKL